MGRSRLTRLSAAQLWLFLRAAGTLGAASAAVAVLPFKRAIAFGAVELRPLAAPLAVGDCVWAVEAAARRVPWRAMCIEQGITAQRLLRRSGIEAVLHYGARQSSCSDKLEAHVWVSVSGEVVLGGEEATRFQEIASFR